MLTWLLRDHGSKGSARRQARKGNAESNHVSLRQPESGDRQAACDGVAFAWPRESRADGTKLSWRKIRARRNDTADTRGKTALDRSMRRRERPRTAGRVIRAGNPGDRSKYRS